MNIESSLKPYWIFNISLGVTVELPWTGWVEIWEMKVYHSVVSLSVKWLPIPKKKPTYWWRWHSPVCSESWWWRNRTPHSPCGEWPRHWSAVLIPLQVRWRRRLLLLRLKLRLHRCEGSCAEQTLDQDSGHSRGMVHLKPHGGVQQISTTADIKQIHSQVLQSSSDVPLLWGRFLNTGNSTDTNMSCLMLIIQHLFPFFTEITCQFQVPLFTFYEDSNVLSLKC